MVPLITKSDMVGFKTGIDIGSTTSKVAVLDEYGTLLYSDYRRHHGKISDTLIDVLTMLNQKHGNIELSLAITGSAGMGISEKLGIPFVQELIATAEYTTSLYPEIRTLIDIGGEDSKIIFFDKDGNHDIRMNGSCAGGTGAFIDQMASLLDISLDDFDNLAQDYKRVYPLASRCGVFAKTDVQNLLSREIPKSDIAASINHAVALQIKNSLLRGSSTHSKVVFSGGPLTFLPSLKYAIMQMFNFANDEILEIEKPELLPAKGAAVVTAIDRMNISILDLIQKLNSWSSPTGDAVSRMDRLFESKEEFEEWKDRHALFKVVRTSIESLRNKECFLGVDSGSTTTKIVLIDGDGRLAFEDYRNNASNSIGAVREGLLRLSNFAKENNLELNICRSAVTGYGEDLIKVAFDFDDGIVETLAHRRAAEVFDKNADFILDIGGQDMKAIFIKDGIIRNIEINEACSSGCGSFIETFANSLEYTVEKFAEIACFAKAPSELGTRCTVFMNSKVKQYFREGAEVADISAGLAYSVIQNCLHKVLKIHNKDMIGDRIIVQGGTFRNPAVHRAFEKILGKEVISPDISELMGAYGCALTALDFSNKGNIKHGKFSLKNFDDKEWKYSTKQINCRGCENQCAISKLAFENDNVFYTGNKCEKIYSNNGEVAKTGISLPALKNDLLFERQLKPDKKILMRTGIPRVLNIYENFPFWSKLLVECGIEVVLSDKSNEEMLVTGSGTLMSDNICFPAKLVHGHIIDLMDKGVERILYPMVTFEKNENPESNNSYNCPVVSGYPDVIRNSMNPLSNWGVPIDTPNIAFNDIGFLKQTCMEYLLSIGVDKKTFTRAFKSALKEQEKFKSEVRRLGDELIDKNNQAGTKAIVLSGRPYQIDALINHGIPSIIAEFGFDVLTEDSLPTENIKLDDIKVLTQWGYPNRLYKTAKWIIGQDNFELIQLNSFGCGPDHVAVDEVKDIMDAAGKIFTLIRIDEHTSTGSLKLRIRSLVESIRLKEAQTARPVETHVRKTTKPFTKNDKLRTILMPFFSPFHSSYITGPFSSMGYKVEVLPQSDKESIELGLKYVNNEICYPATLVIGDVLRALKSGKYDINNVSVALSQTGGQCRASNYLPLMKKALVKNGYENIPVVGISISKSIKKLNYQPGFELSALKLVKQGIIGLLFGDALSNMFYAIAPREKIKGTSMAIADKYMSVAEKILSGYNVKALLNLLRNAVEEFNQLELIRDKIPQIGIVGEVYVKYNPVGNTFIIDDLVSRGIEPVIPPLVNMFAQFFINTHLKHDLKLSRQGMIRHAGTILEIYYNIVDARFERVMSNFRYYRQKENVRQIAANAEKVMNMSNHYFGEGWLIAGDIISFADSGIKNVLCLQPFGCIANHIVARGVEKGIKDLHPELNLLYLDIDAGMSEVNLHNRMYLLIKNATQGFTIKK